MGLVPIGKEIRGRNCGTEFLDADVTLYILFFNKQNDFCNLFIARWDRRVTYNHVCKKWFNCAAERCHSVVPRWTQSKMFSRLTWRLSALNRGSFFSRSNLKILSQYSRKGRVALTNEVKKYIGIAKNWGMSWPCQGFFVDLTRHLQANQKW